MKPSLTFLTYDGGAILYILHVFNFLILSFYSKYVQRFGRTTYFSFLFKIIFHEDETVTYINQKFCYSLNS